MEDCVEQGLFVQPFTMQQVQGQDNFGIDTLEIIQNYIVTLLEQADDVKLYLKYHEMFSHESLEHEVN